MNKNPPPRGRNYPFAQRGSAFWEKCHVTFDQAVDMFYDQTAMQQHLGHDPIVNSLVYKRVTYPTNTHRIKMPFTKRKSRSSLRLKQEASRHLRT